MKKYILLVFLFLSLQVFSQDCNGYWNSCHQDSLKSKYDHYSLVVDKYGQVVSKSAYISNDEQILTYFDLIAGRDYRMSICTDYKYRPIVRLFEISTERLVYDNSLANDTVSIVEFEQDFNMKIYAVVTLPKDNVKLYTTYVDNTLIFREKPKRYCLGIKVESMITRK